MATVTIGRPRPRVVSACAGLGSAGVLAFLAAIALGGEPLSLSSVWNGLWGTADGGTVLMVREFRLPRALVGVLAGAALAVSGALLQTITRNPLASPDLVGISQGAAVAVVFGIVAATAIDTQVLGLLGGLGAAVLVYLLAWRRGTTGYRIILIGVGVSWMCTSLTGYLIADAADFEAQEAVGWLVGNLNARDWVHVGPLAVACAVLLPAALLLGRWLRVLQLGDDVARGLGVPVQPARFAVLVTSVGLVAFGTAAAGPILFVALAAPQVAQRLCGLAHPPVVGSALTGVLLVCASDLTAQQVLPHASLPVGVVTGAVGGGFLIWLLVRANRSGSGG